MVLEGRPCHALRYCVSPPLPRWAELSPAQLEAIAGLFNKQAGDADVYAVASAKLEVGGLLIWDLAGLALPVTLGTGPRARHE